MLRFNPKSGQFAPLLTRVFLALEHKFMLIPLNVKIEKTLKKRLKDKYFNSVNTSLRGRKLNMRRRNVVLRNWVFMHGSLWRNVETLGVRFNKRWASYQENGKALQCYDVQLCQSHSTPTVQNYTRIDYCHRVSTHLQLINIIIITDTLFLVITMAYSSQETYCLHSDSARPSFHMKQLGSHWANSHGIWYLAIFQNISRKLETHFILTAITGILSEKQYTFFITSRCIILRIRNISENRCRRNQKTILCSMPF
jgi:hypothetical protein